MPSSWRIVNETSGHAAFTGEGARRWPGRWNSRGVPVVYTAESRSLAILEALVNFEGADRSRLPPCVLIEARFEARFVEVVEPAALPPGWDAYPATPVTREFGDRWVAERRTAVLRVASVVTRGEVSYILDPAHPDFERIEVQAPEPMLWDPRL
ncbi:MAG: RES family NAD+ phosphorylase [Candidatus Rokuibacteriota bacterium]